jgi:dTMP kinase
MRTAEESRGCLVAFEGLDGAGKSSQQERLAAVLRARGREVVETREPGASAAGRRLRELARAGERLAPPLELGLFLEDRREHVARLIAPALAAGSWVLTDRYYLSTVAYQGARGLDWRELLARCEAEFPRPDLVLLLEIDPARGLERARGRGAGLETFEHREYLERVAAIYRALELPYVERIDADASPDAIHAAVLERVAKRLEPEER